MPDESDAVHAGLSTGRGDYRSFADGAKPWKDRTHGSGANGRVVVARQDVTAGLLSHPWRVMPLLRCRRMLSLLQELGPAGGSLTATSPVKEKEMSLAVSSSSYPLLNLFWTMFEFFLWVIWIWILITVFIDIFRGHDLSGWAKALWFLFVLFIPLIGVIVYLIARGGEMHDRAARHAQRQDEAFRSYFQQAAADSPASTADQLAKLADLRDRRVISAAEFEREKAKVLA
jgi:Phospholipase_D-nuclease N-terminal